MLTRFRDLLGRRAPAWQTWVVVLLVALVGSTSTAGAWHGEHDADQDCAACHLRHHAADLAAMPVIGATDAPEAIAPTPVARWCSSDAGQIPARAPPV